MSAQFTFARPNTSADEVYGKSIELGRRLLDLGGARDLMFDYCYLARGREPGGPAVRVTAVPRHGAPEVVGYVFRAAHMSETQTRLALAVAVARDERETARRSAA